MTLMNTVSSFHAVHFGAGIVGWRNAQTTRVPEASFRF
jgi:hypothetical protein